MSDNNEDQNFILGILIFIIIAVIVGVTTLGINHSTSKKPTKSVNINLANQSTSLGTLEFLGNQGKLTISGVVANDKAKASLMNPAKLLWGENNVVDQIIVKPDAPKFWWNTKPIEVLSKLKGVPSFKLHLNGVDIQGTATVGSENHKASFLEGIKSWFINDAKVQTEVVVDTSLTNTEVDPNVLLNMQIEYPTGSFKIPETVISNLNTIASILKEDGQKIHIIGHTDNIGDSTTNKVLSKNRAEGIKTYLVSQGVLSENIVTEGLGSEKPIADNSTDIGRQLNRRIEFSK